MLPDHVTIDLNVERFLCVTGLHGESHTVLMKYNQLPKLLRQYCMVSRNAFLCVMPGQQSVSDSTQLIKVCMPCLHVVVHRTCQASISVQLKCSGSQHTVAKCYTTKCSKPAKRWLQNVTNFVHDVVA